MDSDWLKRAVLLSRPFFWPIYPLLFFVGLRSAQGVFSPAALLELLALSLPACLLTYGINDAYDAKYDEKNPRKSNVVEGRAVSEQDAALLKKLGPLMVAVLVLSSLPVGNIENIALMCSFAVLIYFYSAEPVRLKEKPVLDSVANGFFYFFAPFALGYTFGAPLATMTTAAAVLLVTCAAGLHALAAIADYEPDREVRNRTIAVALGRKSAATFALACFFVNFLFNWPMLILMMVGVFAAGAVINIITDRWTVMVMRFTIIWGVATALLYLVGSVLLQNI